MIEKADVCILISAGAEWRAVRSHFPSADLTTTPYGMSFEVKIKNETIRFLHGGWGKVAAAGSTQYAIDRWHPGRIINLGTCGGFFGQVERGDVILATKTIIYDIIEQMTDFDQAIEKYSVSLDTFWLPDTPPQPIKKGIILSADRDILPEDIPTLIEKYGASVADWESGAIAWVASKNNLPCLILRGVSDIVDPQVGEAYGNYALFETQARIIMANFVMSLPEWLDVFNPD
jgi:adenosylhomocysteine nucleosidase